MPAASYPRGAQTVPFALVAFRNHGALDSLKQLLFSLESSRAVRKQGKNEGLRAQTDPILYSKPTIREDLQPEQGARYFITSENASLQAVMRLTFRYSCILYHLLIPSRARHSRGRSREIRLARDLHDATYLRVEFRWAISNIGYFMNHDDVTRSHESSEIIDDWVKLMRKMGDTHAIMVDWKKGKTRRYLNLCCGLQSKIGRTRAERDCKAFTAWKKREQK